MKRYFIFKDIKSQKFWNIETEKEYLTVHFGRLGTEGSVNEKTFDSPEKCEKEAEKLIAAKTKKGYTEVEEGDVKEAKDEAKKFYLTSEDVWDKDKNSNDLVEKILKDNKEYKYISIGLWGESDDSVQPIIDMFVKNKNKFNKLEEIYFGDMTYEENECSWIEQGNYEEFLKNMTQLKSLTIKGSNSLRLGKVKHNNLTSLELISGGLNLETIKDLISCDFPSLEKLVLYLGVDDYGFDGDVKDIIPLLSKYKFPRLKTLGIVNSDEQDKVVEIVLNSDILPQLDNLLFSFGVLTDKGGEIILNNADKLKHLKKLDLHYNYLSEEMIKKLKNLPCKTDLSDSNYEKDMDEYDYYPILTE